MTQKEFRNLFDSIECSEEFAARMEALLSEPPAVTEFAETASGVSVTQKRTHWMQLAGLAACLLLVTAGAVFFLHRERIPSEHPVPSEQETTASTTASAESSAVSTTGTKAQTEHIVVTQTLAHTTAGTSSETPETVTETVTETTAPQTQAEEIVMSDPTMPPETEAPTELHTEPKTSAEPETTPETTTTMAPIVMPVLEFDMSMFPMQELTALSEEELLTVGYYYFYAADGLDDYVVTCPYDIDYMDTQGRGFDEGGRRWLPVTDETVTCVADVQADFYDVYTADKASSHVAENYREMEDGLYFAGSTVIYDTGFEGYHLTLDSVTETEIVYTCHISNNGVIATTPFRLVKEEDGWKVSYFIDPGKIKCLVLPGPEYFE